MQEATRRCACNGILMPQVGDGTTSVVLLAGEFLRAAKPFVEEGAHPQVGLNIHNLCVVCSNVINKSIRPQRACVPCFSRCCNAHIFG